MVEASFIRTVAFLILLFPLAAQTPPADLKSTDQNQAEPIPQPNFQLLRDQEDWTSLRDSGNRTGVLDQLKYIPLNSSNSESFLSLGGEIREWFEYFDNDSWGVIPGSNDYLLQRYMFHADVHASHCLRFFVQLKSGLEAGRKGGPRPFDEDRLDVNQAYMDLNFGITPGDPTKSMKEGSASGNDLHPLVIVRLGRQELNYGVGRLVSASEGVNVRSSFDGARVILQPAQWRIDIFGVKPDVNKPGFFDDTYSSPQTLFGVYATDPLKTIHHANVDLYYLASDIKALTFVQGTGRDHRQTFGARLSHTDPGDRYSYDLEGTYQIGTFKSNNTIPVSGAVRAWGLSAFVGRRFSTVRWKPQLTLNTGVTSGDKNPSQSGLQTFFALYPRGDYFGESDQLGPANLISCQPVINLTMSHNVSLQIDSNLIWRESLDDGLYGPSGLPVRYAFGSLARYVGSQSEAIISWESSKRVSWNAEYSRFFVGEFLQQQPPGGRNLNYFAAFLSLKF